MLTERVGSLEANVQAGVDDVIQRFGFPAEDGLRWWHQKPTHVGNVRGRIVTLAEVALGVCDWIGLFDFLLPS